jgi:citrate lyase subunit gamma (acyl carrier protein)
VKIEVAAMAGTLESSDVQITIEPAEQGLSLSISSSVLGQYGRQIKRVVLDTLEGLGVRHGRVTVVDKGALDCTIRARVTCAVYRSAGITHSIPWGEVPVNDRSR